MTGHVLIKPSNKSLVVYGKAVQFIYVLYKMHPSLLHCVTTLCVSFQFLFKMQVSNHTCIAGKRDTKLHRLEVCLKHSYFLFLHRTNSLNVTTTTKKFCLLLPLFAQKYISIMYVSISYTMSWNITKY